MKKSQSEIDKTYGWTVILVKDQLLANLILIGCGLLSSTTIVAFLFFNKGIVIGNFYANLIIWLTPVLYLYNIWRPGIKPQWRAQLEVMNERQKFFLYEGIWTIPFYGWLIKLYKEKATKTTKQADIKSIIFQCMDKKGERLIGYIDSEKLITDPLIYEEFDEKQIAEDENQLLIDAGTRKAYSIDWWKDVAQSKIQLIFEDDIYKLKCKKFGVEFTNTTFRLLLEDSTSDSLSVKRDRLMDMLVKKEKEYTGVKHLTEPQMARLSNIANLIVMPNQVSQTQYSGLGGAGSKPIISVGKK